MLPIVIALFAKFALVIPAEPLRLVLVKPVMVLEPAAIVLFVSVSVVALPTKVSLAAGRVKVVVPAAEEATTVVLPVVPLKIAPVEAITGVVNDGLVNVY